MAQMLAMVVNELQNNWIEQLPHVEFAYNNSISAATGLAPNQVHMGRLPRLPLTIFERTGVAGHQSLARDHLADRDLATDRHAYDIVREYHALTVSRVERSNSALSDALRAVPKFAVGAWVWAYNAAATTRQGAKTDSDAKVLKAKLSLNWTGPCKVLAVGPVPPLAPQTAPFCALSSYTWIYLPICPARMRTCAFRCNTASPVPTPRPWRLAEYLPAGLTQHVLNTLSKKFPPYHVTQDDVSIPLQRLEVEKITGHHWVPG